MIRFVRAHTLLGRYVLRVYLSPCGALRVLSSRGPWMQKPELP